MSSIRTFFPRLSLVILAAVCLADAHAAPTPAPAVTPAPADEKVDTTLFFHIGETLQANSLWAYFRAIGDKGPARFDEFAAMLKKAGAPPDVLQELQRYREIIVKLPWSKSWDQWTDAEKKIWTDVGLNGAPVRKWLLTGNYDKAFFYYLGSNVLDGWFNIEKSIADGSQTLAAMSNREKATLDSFSTIATDSGYVHARTLLTPEASQLLKDLTALKNETDDPLGSGVTQEVVTKTGTATKALRDLARADKLTVAGSAAPTK